MATMTHSEPITMASYVTASNLCMRLASRMFDHAMTAGAILDPQDAAYEAWWILRSGAEHFIKDQTLDTTPEGQTLLKGAMRTAHKIAHPEAESGLHWQDCDCEVAQTIRAIHQLLAGRPGRR